MTQQLADILANQAHPSSWFLMGTDDAVLQTDAALRAAWAERLGDES